ncbi:MAG: hypothetical protein DLM58_14430 [Pseudonocardiales bacterium]|nr:MAG: hypothetical protein DLM58_14430 [Pseudonocardiales bacterium]
MGDSRTRFAILGPLQVCHDGVNLDLGPFKQRVLLAAMLCQPNTVIPVESLIGFIWDGRPPPTARKKMQVYISALRKLVGDRVQHAAYGYSLQVAVDELEVLSFGALATKARDAVRLGESDGARTLFGEASGLWRDQPIVDLRANSFIATPWMQLDR